MENEISQFISHQRQVTSLMGPEFDRNNRENRDRDRDRRPRDRDRDYDRDRRRDRHRDRDRDRDRDRERISTRDVDFENDRRESREFRRRNSPNDSRDTGRSGDSYRDSGKQGDQYLSSSPTNTILIRGLPPHIDENDIRAEVMLTGKPIREVRLMKRKDTGASRGFAFVEFQNLADAQRWMDNNQGQLMLLNQYRVSMFYGQPRTQAADKGPGLGRAQDFHQIRTDWSCTKCGAHNFKRRDNCFKCNISREESDKAKEGDGFDQIGTNPCNTLLFRGLDALTNEESILSVLSTLTALAVKNILVTRNQTTQVSLGYAFIEMSNLSEASQMLEMLQHMSPGFEVDGKAVMVTYSKNTYSTILASLTAHAQPAAQPVLVAGVAPAVELVPVAVDPAYYQGISYQNYEQANAGAFIDPNSGQYVEGSNFDYTGYYEQEGAVSSATPGANGSKSSTQTDTTNAAAAVAQAAIQQAQAVKTFQKRQEQLQKQILTQMQQQQQLADLTVEERLAHEAQQWTATTGTTPSTTQSNTEEEIVKYPPPDVSTYQYDESSGYYYDPTTGLYYDANSQYYFNSTTNTFMYWDSEKSTYLPAPADANTKESQETTTQPSEEKKDDAQEKEVPGKKKEKVKMAKKIAKDMEKWAKSLNAQKEAHKDVMKKFTPIGGTGKESASADAGFAVLEKKSWMDKNPEAKVMREENKLMPPPPMPGGSQKPPAPPASNLVASYGEESDEEEEEAGADSHVDLNKMACLLCKRQFPSREALNRHVQLSDLHKQNLAKIQGSVGELTQQNQATQEQSYRDRAKERREKFGQPNAPPPQKRRQKQQNNVPSPFEQPNNNGIASGNVGNKMLQKMGWSEGQGLGKNQQGRTDIIQAEQRGMGSGLGAKGQYVMQPGETYKDAVKKTMMMRYQDIS
ncbi:unnamed protein product [Owenia fusiformis]|uniref:Uncharacterized protein n=1 Tax=Owenia fusiformis TaxID=6347 RepID=A0A8J1XG25_OWEFU|nr:unnamed protein product [Owenia fusiformis]